MTDIDGLFRAYRASARSLDPSTQCGAVVTDNKRWYFEGINEPTRGNYLSTAEWENRAFKYAVVEHAERNAIFEATRHTSVQGFTMYASWAACVDCARAIVQSGITRLVRHYHPLDTAWAESIRLGDQVLESGGVDIVTVTDPITGLEPVRFSGKLWYPEEDHLDLSHR